MKTLIVFYSKTGNNKALAEYLQKKLNCDIEEIVEKNRRTMATLVFEMIFRKTPEFNNLKADLSSYETIIMASPIWGGIPATPMISFIRKYNLNNKKCMFITISGGALGSNKKLEGFLAKKLGDSIHKCTELLINDILPEEKKNKMKETSSYKMQDKDFSLFDKQINEFLDD